MRISPAKQGRFDLILNDIPPEKFIGVVMTAICAFYH